MRARVVQIGALSAHTGHHELEQWFRDSEIRPRRVFVTHGEPAACDAFRRRLIDSFGWDVGTLSSRPMAPVEATVGAMLQLGSAPCMCGRPHHDTALVAITGGPGGGKTAVLQLAARAFCEHVAVLPEAASIVFGGGFPRHDTEPGRRAAQTAIFHVQRQVEALVIEERRVAIALCDRGTIDGLAYWTGPRPAYWEQVGTALEHEIDRYAAVVHLQTPDLAGGYNHENPLRVESAQDARILDERIASAWETHPRRFVIPSTDDFTDKALAALKTIRDQLPSCCHQHPL